MGLRSFSRYRHLLWIIALALVASGTLLLAACGSTSNANTSTSTPTSTTAQQQGSTATSTTASGGNTFNVSMVEKGAYAFDPVTITIPKGSTVTWTNKSDATHTVTSDTTAFTTSADVTESKTFQMVFATAGTYTYHCKYHASMKATIIVTP